MKILIAGICGFTGSTLARTFQEFDSNVEVSGIDNFLRAGGEQNRSQLRTAGVRVLHAGRPLERRIAETALMGESALQRISELQAQREGTNGH